MLWNNTNLPDGIYLFEYKVPGSDCFEENSIIVVFELEIDCEPLSLDLLNFDVEKYNNKAKLWWEVSEEPDVKLFQIERSSDVRSWPTIGEVNVSASSSKKNSSFTFLDSNPLNGINLYRIKSLFADNTFEYSKAKFLKFENEKNISIYPNLASNNIVIEGLSDGDKIILINAVGNIINSQYATNEKESLDLSNFPSRLYYIFIDHKDGDRLSNKFSIIK